jgi:ATP synthase subunit 6
MQKAYAFFDQFEIIRILPIHPFGNFDISITNSTVFLLLAALYFIFIYHTNIENGTIVPGRYQSIVEILYETIHDMIKDNIPGRDGHRFFPFLFTIFVFILIINLFGLVPYTFSPTAHFALTFGLSTSIFVSTLIIGFRKFKLNYFSFLMTNGAPMVMSWFLVPIELISHVATALTLGLRLAGNITAGHLLFSILSSFAWQMLMAGGIIAVASIFPLVICLAITILEMAVSAIQAYVFVLLTVIYLNNAMHLH